jgi:hypothetical protein
VGTGIAADSDAGIRKLRLRSGRDFRRKGRENEVDILHGGRRGRDDFDLPDVLRKWRIKAPFYNLSIGFSRTAIGSGKRRKFEPGMIRKKFNKSLTNRAGSTEHSNIDHDD